MAGRHLSKFVFEVSTDDIPRVRPGGPFTDDGRALAAQMEMAVRRTAVLTQHIAAALRKTKASICAPPVSMVFVTLRREAVPRPARLPPPAKVLALDIPYDPRDLTNIPSDREAQGKLHLELAREALKHLRLIEGFPEGAIEEGCASFERNNFALWLKAGQRLIPNTRLKGLVAVEVTPVATTRFLLISYRGKELARAILNVRDDGPDFATSKFFSGFELEGSVVTLGEDPYAVEVPGRTLRWPAEKVDLRDHPQALALAKEKGWIAD